MNEKIMVCTICGKPILDEKFDFSKLKNMKIIYFHTKCYENLKKKG